MRPDPARLDPESYSLWVDVATRETDLDAQNHVNSLSLGAFFREGWTRLQVELFGASDRAQPYRPRFLVVRITFDYVAEVLHPSTVQVGAGVSAVGRSSLTLGLGLFHEGLPCAVSDYTVVHADQTGPAPLPAHARESAREYLLPGVALSEG